MEYKKINIQEDLNQLLSLEKFWTYIGEKPWTVDNYLKILPKKWDWSLAAISEDKIIGYIINSQSINDEKIMLGHKLVVHKDYRNMGIAEHLVFLTNQLADCDLVIGKVNLDNIAAQNFWKKQGFIFCETVNCEDGKERNIIKYLKKPIQHSKPFTGREEIDFVKELLVSQNLCIGNIVEQLESLSCEFFNRKHCVAISSGSEALRCLSKFYSKSFIVPSFCCRSVYDNIECTPGDVDSKGNLLKPENDKLTLGVHSWCSPLGWTPTIDDRTWNLEAKSNSEFTVVSLGATKMLTAAKGGLILTDDPELYKKIKKIKHEGMSDIHAAIAVCQIKKYKKIKKIKKNIEKLYKKNKIKNQGNEYRFIFFVKDAEKTVCNAKKCNINICHPVDLPLHVARNFNDELFPNTKKIWDTWVSLPFHPQITQDEIEKISYFLIQNKDI
jgi:GNAT superfamily N-acetyltransferase